MRWQYSLYGYPMWEWPVRGEEQAVLFCEIHPPFYQGGFPPITDAELQALEVRR